MTAANHSPWPSFDDDEIDAVKRVLSSNRVNYWTGDECRKFENEFASFTNSKYAIAVSNGTVALDLALKGLGIGKDDEVIVTSRTFIASVSSIINCGAKPIFADIDCNSQNITAQTISSKITKKTKAIVCVHLAGWPCDMDPILVLAQEHDLFVIEDCAQAHGARYKGNPVGSIGDVGCWSFCQDKIMSTGGEGGMVTTDNEGLWHVMWSYKDHGKSWDAVNRKDHKDGFRWLHESFGTNWRMTEMQAAIGRVQLKKMPKWSAKRQQHMKKMWDVARNFELFRVPHFSCDTCSCQNKPKNQCTHAAYKCYFFVNGSESLRNDIIKKIKSFGVPCFSGSCSEVYLEKAFDSSGARPQERLKNAMKLGETSLMFLCHPTLSMSEIDQTCDAISNVALSL